MFANSLFAQEPKNGLWNKEPQIEVGKPNFLIDSLGNVISIPEKIILLNPKMSNHRISGQTINMMEQYIKDNPKTMSETKIRFNQFTPIGDFKRLVRNKKIHWWWRVFPGVPVTVLSMGGRLMGGDHYNPYTDTINIYSDVPVVALHEAGHATDATEKSKEGWSDYYALGRVLLPVTLHQEYTASDKAINYLKDKRDYKEEKNAYKTLCPAFGTYVGGGTGLPYGNVIGAAVGHAVSFIPRQDNRLRQEAWDHAYWSKQIAENLEKDPMNKSLIHDKKKADEVWRNVFVSNK